jgi:NAD+ synthase (glutamine-hydrolysing)
MSLTFCIAQLNFVVGDLAGNARKIIEAGRAAHARGARLLLTPELSLCGYAAEDLFLRPSFMSACEQALGEVARGLADLPDLTVVVGHPQGGDLRTRSVAVHRRLNRATVLRGGQTILSYAKQELPNYQVFDERRYFTPGTEPAAVFEIDGVRVGLLVCEDAWFETQAQAVRDAGADVLAVINASPFHEGKHDERVAVLGQRCRATGLPLIYAHMVGAQDELVFDGASFVLDAQGQLRGLAPSFQEDLYVAELVLAQPGPLADMPRALIEVKAALAQRRSNEAELWDALVLAVRDYVGKNGFPGVLLGLSGGIDSALVLAIAVDALGADRVRAVMMPSPYTADISWLDAREMARRLGVRYDEISISPQFEAFKLALAAEFQGLPEDSTEENIQARIRGVLLMALSNKTGSIVLTTGNKSEMATGYCTLYGDMAGGYAVLKDVLKTRVFALARWRNLHNPYDTADCPIPERIITRPPSAELRADQTDQDSLPPYEVLDDILVRFVEDDQSEAEIVAAGHDPAVVSRVTRLLRINEYKRRQSAIGPRVTHRNFGKDWRYPIVNHFRESSDRAK